MGQCNAVWEWRELAIYEIVPSALLQRDISTGIKEAGVHLRLMQIRSRCLRSAHSGLRSRTVSLLPLVPSFSSVVVLSHGHSRSPSLPPARTSRAGSPSWRIEMLPDVTSYATANTVEVLSALPASIKILISIPRGKLTFRRESIIFPNRRDNRSCR